MDALILFFCAWFLVLGAVVERTVYSILIYFRNFISRKERKALQKTISRKMLFPFSNRNELIWFRPFKIAPIVALYQNRMANIRMAFGVVADSGTFRCDEAPNLSLLKKIILNAPKNNRTKNYNTTAPQHKKT